MQPRTRLAREEQGPWPRDETLREGRKRWLVGIVMVAKWSNPSCSASFRYLEEGRLFRLVNDPALRSSKVAAAEYFWLCPSCSSTMTLHISEGGSVIPVGLREPVHNSGDFISANRHRGLLLSGVSFLAEGQRRRARSVG
jgi:hypothetical protein